MKDSREIALEILNYFDKNGYIPSKKVEIAFSTLSFESKKFAANLYLGTLRKRVLIDYILMKFLKRPDKLPVAIKNALRIGVFQLYFMDAVPDYAAIKESVALVGVKSFRNLVNAVLRKVAGERVDLNALPLWLKYSHPKWLVEYIKGLPHIGDIKPLLEYNQTPPSDAFVASESELAELEEKGFLFASSDFSDSYILVERGIDDLKLQRIDEMEYILKGMEKEVIRMSGSALSLLNQKPWLFFTLEAETFSREKRKLIQEILEVKHGEFLLMIDSYSLEETRDLVFELNKAGYECADFDSTLKGSLKATEMGYGAYYFPPDAPRPCFITYLKKR